MLVKVTLVLQVMEFSLSAKPLLKAMLINFTCSSSTHSEKMESDNRVFNLGKLIGNRCLHNVEHIIQASVC